VKDCDDYIFVYIHRALQIHYDDHDDDYDYDDDGPMVDYQKLTQLQCVRKK